MTPPSMIQQRDETMSEHETIASGASGAVMTGDLRIVAAALKVGPIVFSIPRPARHNDIFYELARIGCEQPAASQGFLDSRGHFVGRDQAREIAGHAGQIKTKHGNPNELYSEDLW